MSRYKYLIIYCKTFKFVNKGYFYSILFYSIYSDGNVQNIGRLTILPSSYIGSPRHEYAQAAMTYVRNYGTPDLFITFTCNPKWTEIERELDPPEYFSKNSRL